MNKLLSILVLLLAFQVSGQLRMLPVSENFKDLAFSPAARLKGPSVFPVSNFDTPFFTVFRDSSKRYSNFGHFLYQRQLIEITDKETNSKLWITPVVELSYGREIMKDSMTRISQNTRGLRLEGSIGKRFFFTTSFYENQAFLPSYMSAYVSQRGEQFMNDTGYTTQNAVIPGGARTKAFKGTGFDYAYATGAVSWAATKRLQLHFGNQQLFVGTGHRSLLWSDNSFPFMNLRARYALNDKLDIQVMRGQGINQLRRPFKESAEAWYEKKSVGFTILTYQPIEGLSIGLFEGGMWSRGDSVHQRNTDPLFYVPLPGVAAIQQSINNRALSVAGLDLKIAVGRQLIYGQFALTPEISGSMAFQAGTRLFPFKNPEIQLLLEYNHADRNAYTSSDARLNYSSNNLPVAHPAASGFDEVVMRFTWQKKYWFATIQTNYFITQSESATLLMPTVKPVVTTSQSVINQMVEFGYRFNKEYGFELFAGFRYRYADGTQTYERSWVNAGIRTLLNNRYFDL